MRYRVGNSCLPWQMLRDNNLNMSLKIKFLTPKPLIALLGVSKKKVQHKNYFLDYYFFKVSCSNLNFIENI